MVGFRRSVTLKPPPCPLGGGLTTVSACDESVGPAGCHRLAPVGSLALLLTHSGHADAQSDGVSFTHRPRRLVAVAEGARYEERMPEGAWWHLSYLLLNGPWCDDLNQALRERPGAAVIIDLATPPVRLALVESVQIALDQPTAWSWLLQSRLSGLIAELLTLAAASEAPLTAQVGRMIDGAPHQTWQVADVAGRLGLSRAIFVRKFLSESGIPPARWIRNRRIDLARRLLTQGRTIADVADRLGFANPYHFSRVFKAVTGMPPSHIRPSSRVIQLHG